MSWDSKRLSRKWEGCCGGGVRGWSTDKRPGLLARKGREMGPVGPESPETAQSARGVPRVRGVSGARRQVQRTWEEGLQGGRALQGLRPARRGAPGLFPRAARGLAATGHPQPPNTRWEVTYWACSRCSASFPPAGRSGSARPAGSTPQRPLQPGGYDAEARGLRAPGQPRSRYLPGPGAAHGFAR